MKKRRRRENGNFTYTPNQPCCICRNGKKNTHTQLQLYY